MKRLSIIALCLAGTLSSGCSTLSKAPPVDHSPKVVLITIDGLRWQEVFGGADPRLVRNTEYVTHPKALAAKYWKDSPTQRRETLMPFLWEKVNTQGQIYGDRSLGNKMNVANNVWASYPGYSEIFTGAADDLRIKNNDTINNPNITLFDIIDKSPHYHRRVAAYASWNTIPYIMNQHRNHIPVNAGFTPVHGLLTEVEIALNQVQAKLPKRWEDCRYDGLTHQFAIEGIKKHHPKFIYVAYGETDELAHDGEYDQYLEAASKADRMIKQLWVMLQADPFYKDKTTLIITTDHGRGSEPLEGWKDHGNNFHSNGKVYTIKGSDEVWLAAFGPQVSHLGVVKTQEQLYSNQIAATIAKLLDVPFSEPNTGNAINTLSPQ